MQAEAPNIAIKRAAMKGTPYIALDVDDEKGT